jgi:hypothetical protein
LSLVLPSGEKTEFGPAGHCLLLRACAIPCTSAVLKRILRVVSASIISDVAYQFHIQSGQQRKTGWVGHKGQVACGKKFPGEEEV